jgi:hypothetical protein
MYRYAIFCEELVAVMRRIDYGYSVQRFSICEYFHFEYNSLMKE